MVISDGVEPLQHRSGGEGLFGLVALPVSQQADLLAELASFRPFRCPAVEVVELGKPALEQIRIQGVGVRSGRRMTPYSICQRPGT